MIFGKKYDNMNILRIQLAWEGYRMSENKYTSLKWTITIGIMPGYGAVEKENVGCFEEDFV